jgi:hypothetical protein
MIKITKIGQCEKPILTTKNTGYAAAGALLLATTRVFGKSKAITKTHKFIGCLAGVLTLLHIGTVEYLRFKCKKM